MRFFLLTLIPLVTAFTPNLNGQRIHTELGIDRRDVVFKGAAVLATVVGLPQVSMAAQEHGTKEQQYGDRDWNVEQNRMSQGVKFDLNRSFASDYKNLKGMYPSAAEKLASNGPYNSVKDIYKIKDLTERDKELFRNYENTFTVSKASSERDWAQTSRVMPRGERIEINSSVASDYRNMGMPIGTAEKLASNGPYKQVKDIYKIKNLTDRDKELFRDYENRFTVNKSYYDRVTSS